MVLATVNLHGTDIHRIKIRGHADSVQDDAQYDLVCAEISAVSVGVLNSIEELCGENACDVKMESGLIDIIVLEDSDTMQVILNTLKIQLQTIENTNSDFLEVTVRQFERAKIIKNARLSLRKASYSRLTRKFVNKFKDFMLRRIRTGKAEV